MLIVILLLLGDEAQALGGDVLGGVKQHQQGAPLGGLEPSPLGRTQPLLWELKVAQVPQYLACAGKPLFQPRRKRAQRREAPLVRAHDAQGRFEQLTPLGRAFGQSICAQQRLGLLGLEAVTLHRGGHGLLLVGAQRTKRVGQRQANGPLVYLAPQRLAQSLGERESQMYPAGFTTAQMRDGLGSQLLLVAQRPDHSRLVHRRQRARRPVGLEQGDHLLGGRPWRLQQHRHPLDAKKLPACQPLEAVDQLVGSVLGGYHPQRQRPQRRLPGLRWPPPASEPGQARAKLACADPLEPGAARGLSARDGLIARCARRAHGCSPAPIIGATDGPPGGTAST